MSSRSTPSTFSVPTSSLPSKQEKKTPSTSKSGSIVLILDPDEAGQRAAEVNGRALTELFGSWGTPRYPSEPYSQALARIQREIDELAQEIQAREALDMDTAQTEYVRVLAWEYMEDLLRKEKPSVYSRATSPDELAAAVLAEDRPLADEGKGRIDFEKIKRENPPEDFIGQYTDLRPKGEKFVGKCALPDHQDDTASLWIYPETRSWYCFGCNRGGDIIDFAKLKGINLW